MKITLECELDKSDVMHISKADEDGMIRFGISVDDGEEERFVILDPAEVKKALAFLSPSRPQTRGGQ